MAEPPSVRDINPSVSPEYARIVAKCLHKEPPRRFERALVFANAPDAWASGFGASTPDVDDCLGMRSQGLASSMSTQD